MSAEKPPEEVDLALGTALALSAVPDPDNETLDEQHVRINSSLAAEVQQQEYQHKLKQHNIFSLWFVLFSLI